MKTNHSNGTPDNTGSRAARTAHHEHAAAVEGYGIEETERVPTVQFQYPDDEEPQATVVRDEWRDNTLLNKCQKRFATIPGGDDLTMPLLDKRLDVLQIALREAVEKMDVSAICRLADKAHATAERIAAEQLARSTPSAREMHAGVLILDDAGRGKVIIHLEEPASRQTRRWIQMCGFFGSGDGATFWRRRTFRRGENIALQFARHCAQRIVEDRKQIQKAQAAEFSRSTRRSIAA